MSFIIKDGEQTYVGSFSETSESQIVFLVTNFEEFYVEKLSTEVFVTRIEELNENIRIKKSRIIKTLKEEKPESCSIIKNDGTLRVELKFVLTRPLYILFTLSKCDCAEIGWFAVGLMKLTMEYASMNFKLKKAVEAKDLEIEEYKSNGAILVRGTKI